MKDKELIIIVYKIAIGGLTRQHAEEQIYELMKEYSFSQDEQLKENYLIREIWLPIREGDSDVKVIYPINSNSTDLIDLAAEVARRIKESPDETLKRTWNKLVRELKLKKLYEKES